MNISHDSANRFLLREQYEPEDLFEEIKASINLIGGTLSADDTIVEKLYSDSSKVELIGYFWSGKHKKPIKGINLISLYYTAPNGDSVPINYRLYNKEEGKTKNEYLREMIKEVLEWGVMPKTITTDSWYSSKDNLKFFRERKFNFLVGIAKNRQVKVMDGKFCKVEQLDIPEDGMIVYLKEFGWVKVFQRVFKNEIPRYYVIHQTEESQLEVFTRSQFRSLCSIHWGIECYHRALKQLCGLSKFLVRTSQAIANHIFCSLRAFCQLELMRIQETIENWYEIQRELYLKVAREFIIKRAQEQKALAS
ncbi:transposase IS701 family protein (plasmid) [Gloeothece citriformis PCC 7424]|uniref:Transposase IS701 family protein n=2 Tax=Gloeothece TaxID=28070 RepID=B7KMJ8_GLOC7|nr:transposase IS701 family protein [Gloeothece citriformis PCC 7424]